MSPTDVGDVVRTVRADTLGRQVDAASRLGVSVSMLGDLERGAGGSQLDLTLQVLADLGLDVVLVPRDAARSLRATPNSATPPPSDA
ncbi:MAG: transcriptional regulator [Gemmatimonadetes bacterium]|nr:transcriptional regulator [Gemmatimonadota bacterium]